MRFPTGKSGLSVMLRRSVIFACHDQLCSMGKALLKYL